ncbi:MAG: hypothetical protein J5802_13135 [Butyrivibrio sp.]|nr:hypothetical protein [Butyrivibrio sp.]
MKRRNYIGAAGIIVMTALLVACKPSDEKLNEVDIAREVLKEAKEKAENTYLDITDEELRGKLDELAAKEKDIEEKDFSKMSDRKINEYLPKIEELKGEYDTVQQSLDSTLQEETALREEAAKNRRLEAYIVNSTGITLTEVVLHDVTNDVYSENLLGDGVSMEPGHSLVGAGLDINVESSAWEILVKDGDNNSYTLACGDFSQVSDAGVSIILKYDPASKTGSADLGGN